MLRQNHEDSYENTSHPPPYLPSADDIFSGQAAALAGKDATIDTSELALEVEKIQDTTLLRRLLIEKEHERQHLASDLDLAARLGLGLQQQLEHVEMESYAKIQALQDQNMMLQSKANRSKELSTQLAGSENEIRVLTTQNQILQREVDMCRKDFKSFRSELDELTEQMSEMASEMMEAKNKVNAYARRLGEVEQELASTQELNVNLQIQLENALQKQKQSHSTTTMAVKSIQSDLGKVFSESDSMKQTLEELESRQVKCEGKVTEMITNTREYAQLLEEAQDTIHNLRQESDMQGGGWLQTRTPRRQGLPSNAGTATANNANNVTNRPRQSLASELDPDHWDDSDDGGPGGSSLSAELGGRLGDELSQISRSLSNLSEATEDTDPALTNDQDDALPSGNGGGSSLAAELHLVEAATQTSPLPMSPANNQRRTRGDHTTPPATPRSPSRSPSVSQPSGLRGRASTASLPNRVNGDSELQTRLETSNIFRNMLSGMSRPPWNPSVALEKPPHTPSIRAPLTGSSSSLTSSPTPHRRNSRATSPQTSALSASTGSLFALTNGHRGSISASSTSSSSSPALGRSRSGAIDHQPGLRYLLSASSSTELSNVITKTKANKSAGPLAQSKSTSSVISLVSCSSSNSSSSTNSSNVVARSPATCKDRSQQKQQQQQQQQQQQHQSSTSKTEDSTSQKITKSTVLQGTERPQPKLPSESPAQANLEPSTTSLVPSTIKAIDDTPQSTDAVATTHDTLETNSASDTTIQQEELNLAHDTKLQQEEEPSLQPQPFSQSTSNVKLDSTERSSEELPIAAAPSSATNMASLERVTTGRMSPSRPPVGPAAGHTSTSSIRGRSTSPLRRSSLSGGPASGRSSPTPAPLNPGDRITSSASSGCISPGGSSNGGGTRPPASAFGQTNRSPSPSLSRGDVSNPSSSSRPGLTRTMSANSAGSNTSSSSIGRLRVSDRTTGANLSPSSSQPTSRRSSFSH